MKTMNKIAMSLGLVALLSGCSRDESIYSPITKNVSHKPKSYIELANYQKGDQVVALDLDGDGAIDEALKLHGITFENIGLALGEPLPGIKKEHWVHLVAKDYEGKTFFDTPNTRTMTAEERAGLTSANKVLSNSGWDNAYRRENK